MTSIAAGVSFWYYAGEEGRTGKIENPETKEMEPSAEGQEVKKKIPMAYIRGLCVAPQSSVPTRAETKTSMLCCCAVPLASSYRRNCAMITGYGVTCKLRYVEEASTAAIASAPPPTVCPTLSRLS